MKKLFFVLSFLAFVPAVQAQMDCEGVPSCAELGYTQDSCAGGKGVRCPFDESKFYCSGVKQLPDAENPGVTDENWTAKCADKIAYCTAYNTECQCTACEDTYLISDGACVPECDKSVDICATENKVFNAETCTCEACPENYEFNSETKACEQIACDKTKVEHCTTYSSDYEPCTCQACETNYLLVDGVCVLQCSGANQCLYQGSCVTCYESCPVRWQYYLDEEPDGSACSVVERIYQGSGYGAEATYKPCYNECVTCQKACGAFTGLDNTTDAVAQLGDKGLAFYAATQFYVGNKNGAFGQGQWYLPSIVEWMEFYGTEISNAIPAEYSSAGATGDNMALIKNALNILKNKGVEAEPLSGHYFSSTSGGTSGVIMLNASNGERLSACSYYGCSSLAFGGASHYVRCSLFLTLTINGTAPAIGDVMYEDKTYGAASDYDGSKTPVGIIAAVSGNDVKIINLKNLTFSSENTVGNFDPDNPYGGSVQQTYFLFDASSRNDLYNTAGHFPGKTLSNAISVMNKYNCTCPFKPGACTLSTATCAAEGKAFNADTCVCEDCSSKNGFGKYLFDSETNECREICYKADSNCSEYDSDWYGCKCTACNRYFDGYLFEGSCRENYCHYYGDMCKVDYCKQCASETECAVCARGFTLKNNKCVYSADECFPGMVLYDDFNCYDPDNFPSDRTPIGIIFRADDVNTGRLLALSLDEVVLPWSENLVDTETGCNDVMDGQANTDCIVAAGAEEGSAAVYCSKYGVTASDKGKWYLPAAKEVQSMIGQGTPIACLFDASALKFGSKTVLGGNDFYIGDLATSTENSSTYFVAIQRGTASFQLNKKSARKHIRCVIDYSNSSDCPIIEHCGSYQDDCSCRWCEWSPSAEYKLSDDGLSCIAQ